MKIESVEVIGGSYSHTGPLYHLCQNHLPESLYHWLVQPVCESISVFAWLLLPLPVLWTHNKDMSSSKEGSTCFLSKLSCKVHQGVFYDFLFKKFVSSCELGLLDHRYPVGPAPPSRCPLPPTGAAPIENPGGLAF